MRTIISDPRGVTPGECSQNGTGSAQDHQCRSKFSELEDPGFQASGMQNRRSLSVRTDVNGGESVRDLEKDAGSSSRSAVTSRWRQWLKNLIGPACITRLRCLARGYDQPRWGNLRRTTPFSQTFGFERGTPVDRYYLHNFLAGNAEWICGDVLEIQMAAYTQRYGHDLVRTHSVDINPRVSPDYVCDLAHSNEVIPDEAYDCFLLPNTLQHLKDLDACLGNVLRVVRPGGVILASAAGLLPLIPDTPDDDYWRLTQAGWSTLAGKIWPQCEIRVESHGNCLAVVAAMLGLAAEELDRRELDVHDPRYPLLVTVFARKPA